MKTPNRFERRKVVLVLVALCLAFAIASPSFAWLPTSMDVPVISCAGSTQTSISILVCALNGPLATGATSGFSIQWMTRADYDQYGWPTDRLNLPPSFCKASFDGVANPRYDLCRGECVTVNIGDLLLDEGAGTPCPVGLACGTEYVFRAFAYANCKLDRSDFTGTLTCSTLPCGSEEGCTYTQGYWKNHGPEGCANGNNENEWPVTSMTLGNVSYTDLDLCAILHTPAKGNGLIILAHQLIAAKLNAANGSDDTTIAGAVAAADALIGDLVVPPVGSGYLSPGDAVSLIVTLAQYNEGAIGPGHCD